MASVGVAPHGTGGDWPPPRRLRLASNAPEPLAAWFSRRVQLLEVSQYLENYLWPNFPASGAPRQHVMSILVMVNEKFREGVPAWACFRDTQPVSPHTGARAGVLVLVLVLGEREGVWGGSCQTAGCCWRAACLAAAMGAHAGPWLSEPVEPCPPARRACPSQEKLPAFFEAYTGLRTQLSEMKMHERVAYMLFTIRAFQVGAVAGAPPSWPAWVRTRFGKPGNGG